MEGSAAKGNDWNGGSAGAALSSEYTTKSPATDKIEKLLLQYKIHVKTTQTTEHTSQYVAAGEAQVPQLNQHMVCELELWNAVNHELSSLNMKPITFTADHATPTSDQLVISLTSSTVARHTISSLIKEITHKEDKIKALKRKISKLCTSEQDEAYAQPTSTEAHSISPQKFGHAQTDSGDSFTHTTAREGYDHHTLREPSHAQSTPLATHTPQSELEKEDYMSIIVGLKQENEKLKGELSSRPDMHDLRTAQNRVKDLLLTLKEKEIQLLDFDIMKKKLEDVSQQPQETVSSRSYGKAKYSPSKLDRSADSKPIKTQHEHSHLSIITKLEQENERLQDELAARPNIQELRSSENKVQELFQLTQDQRAELLELDAIKRKLKKVTAQLEERKELDRSLKLAKDEVERDYLSIVNKLEQENKKLESALAEKSAEIEAIQKKVQRLMQTVQEKEAELQDFEATKERVHDLTSQLQQKEHLLSSYVEQANEMVKAKAAERDHSAAIDELKLENKRLKRELAARPDERDFSAAQNKVEELQLKLQLKESEMMALKARKRKLDQRMEEDDYETLPPSFKDPYLSSLKMSRSQSHDHLLEQDQLVTIKRLKLENKRLLAELADRPDMQKYQSIQNKLKEALHNLKDKESQLQHSKANMRIIEDLKAQLHHKEQLLSSYKDARSSMEDYSAIIAQLKLENKRLRAELDSRPSMDEFTDNQERMSKLIHTLQEKEAQVQDLKAKERKLEDLTAKLDQKEYELILSSLKEPKKAGTPLKRDRSRSHAFLEDVDNLTAIRHLERENERLRAELAARPDMVEFTESQKKLEKLLDTLKEKETQLKELKAKERKIDELTEKLEQKDLELLVSSIKEPRRPGMGVMKSRSRSHGLYEMDVDMEDTSVIKQLKRENQRLHADLAKRPDMYELRATRSKVQELLKALQEKETELLDYKDSKRKLDEISAKLQLKDYKKRFTSYKKPKSSMRASLESHSEDSMMEEVDEKDEILSTITQLEEENRRLQAELAARPNEHELKATQDKVKQLQRALQEKEHLLASHKDPRFESKESEELMKVTVEQDLVSAISQLEHENERLHSALGKRSGDVDGYRTTIPGYQPSKMLHEEAERQQQKDRGYRAPGYRPSEMEYEEAERQDQRKSVVYGHRATFPGYRLRKREDEEAHRQQQKVGRGYRAAAPGYIPREMEYEEAERQELRESGGLGYKPPLMDDDEAGRQQQIESGGRGYKATLPGYKLKTEHEETERHQKRGQHKYRDTAPCYIPSEMEYVEAERQEQRKSRGHEYKPAMMEDDEIEGQKHTESGGRGYRATLPGHKLKREHERQQQRDGRGQRATVPGYIPSKMEYEEAERQELRKSGSRRYMPALMEDDEAEGQEEIKSVGRRYSATPRGYKLKREREETERQQKRNGRGYRASVPCYMPSGIEDEEAEILELRESGGRGYKPAKVEDDEVEEQQFESGGHGYRATVPGFKLCTREYEDVEEQQQRESGGRGYRATLPGYKLSRKEQEEAEKQIKKEVFTSHKKPPRPPGSKPLHITRSRSHDLMTKPQLGKDHLYLIEQLMQENEILHEELDQRPLGFNRLQELMEEVQRLLSVSDEEEIVFKLRDVMRTLRNHSKLEKRLLALLQLVFHESVPVSSPQRNLDPDYQVAKPSHDVWCEVTWQKVVRILRTWVFHMKGIQELQYVIGEVCEHLQLRPMPHDYHENHRKGDKSSCVVFTCQELAVLLRRWLLDNKHLEASSQQLVRAMIVHFQHLFDIPHLDGVYPAMSVLYQETQQHNTVIHRLKESLKLDESCSRQQLVSTVEYMMKEDNTHCLVDIHKQFGPIEPSELIEKMKLCNQFFSPFQKVITEMQQILGVKNVSGIIPAIRELQKKGQSSR